MIVLLPFHGLKGNLSICIFIIWGFIDLLFASDLPGPISVVSLGASQICKMKSNSSSLPCALQEDVQLV